MKLILGIDIGGSTTKIVGFDGKIKVGSLQVKADDQVTSLYGAIGKFLQIFEFRISEVESVVLTGVGSSFIKGDVYGIKTYKVDEFNSVGYGGLYVSSKDSGLVVSMGTGTSYVLANGEQIAHVGGSGVGGGTLIGLSNLLLNTKDLDLIDEYINKGSLSNVDLSIGDICRDLIPSLPPDTTASNFGYIKSGVTKNDLAFGIINMVYQTVGMMAIFYLKNSDTKNIILTGSMTRFSCIGSVFKRMEILHNVDFIIPNDAIFSTAMGAIIYYQENLQ